MSDETTIAQPAAPKTAPAPDASESRLAAQIAKATSAIESSDPDESESAPVAAKSKPVAPAKPGTPPKDAKGRFLPASKSKAEAKPAAPVKTDLPDETEEQPTEKPEPDAAVTPRALLKAGKIEEAFRAAFGEDVDPKQYAISSKQWVAFRHETKQTRAKFQAMEQKLESKATELLSTYEPFVEAKRCYDAGDYAGMVKAITKGELEPSEFNRRLIHSYAGKDPHVEKLERELREFRQAEEKRRQDEMTQAEQRRQAEERAAFVEQLTEQLTSSEDPRIAKASTRSAFVRSVFQILDENWDPESKTTLPVQEAAEMALERIFSAHSDWSEVFGAGQPQSPVLPAQAGKGPERQAVAARPPPRSLRQSEAAEAAPRSKLSKNDLFSKFEGLMRVATPG